MGIKKLSSSGVLAIILCAAPTFADTVSGTGGAGFQNWAATNLNENGSPYWDNTSLDGPGRNVGFYLVDAPTAHLPGAPGALPYWGNSFSTATDSGGTADLNLFFQGTGTTNSAILQLEVAGRSNINQFGWYDVSDNSVTPTLHQLFAGPDVALVTNNFAPSTQYGFYITTLGGVTYYTQSSRNGGSEADHQHFAVFEDTSAPAPGSYWIGVEDMAVNEFAGNENNAGDYNDMLIHLSVLQLPGVPEPSTAMLVVSGSLLVLGLTRRRSIHHWRSSPGFSDEA